MEHNFFILLSRALLILLQGMKALFIVLQGMKALLILCKAWSTTFLFCCHVHSSFSCKA
jgi:hypothetical protein